MAWIRTALSMIGFGFIIYKFFQYLAEEIAAGNIRRPQTQAQPRLEPRSVGNSGVSRSNLAAPGI